jgi:hypothetical protein
MCRVCFESETMTAGSIHATVSRLKQHIELEVIKQDTHQILPGTTVLRQSVDALENTRGSNCSLTLPVTAFSLSL